MHFRELFLSFFTALALAVPGSASAQDGVPRDALAMSDLDPNAFDAIAQALTGDVLKTLGFETRDAATRRAMVRVVPADCKAPCTREVGYGLCLCAPDSEGACPAGGTKASANGGPLCKTLPANATIFATEGGLGTTRVTVALAPPG